MHSTEETDPSLNYMRAQWAEGDGRLQRFSEDSRKRRVMEDVIDELFSELNRRVGQTFTTTQLVEEYRRAELWCQETAHRVAPEDPWAWEMSIVQDAAFHRFARGAQDYQA